MTATKQSRPAQLADEIEALGWEVSRGKVEARRIIHAQRPDGQVLALTFERRTVGFGAKDVLVSAEHFHSGGERDELKGVADALRIARTPPAVPFALDAPDAEVLSAVAGRLIQWRSRLTDTIQSGAVPRGGVHLRLVSGETRHGPIAPADRVLHFTDPHGFHAVRIGAIVKVS